MLEHAGWDVQREFYVNDAGVQMDIFAKSVAARYLQLCGRSADFADDWYQGAYITEIAARDLRGRGRRVGRRRSVSRARRTSARRRTRRCSSTSSRVLHGMGVDFDVWFSERTLHLAGPDGMSEVDRAIEQLRAAGYIYELDGATWFRSTDFGDDKDRVLQKADGEFTYFAADIAYHKDKFDRGFDRVINIWGADHHGYVARMKAAAAALGHAGQLDVVIGQLVTLLRNGEVVRMSKRTGEMVTFEELLDEVGADAARYFFLRRSTDQPLDFDIGLAKEQSSENPVFYVQYAHARICSILRKAAGLTAGRGPRCPAGRGAARRRPTRTSRVLTRACRAGADAQARRVPRDGRGRRATRSSPHKLTFYAEELAAAFHQFYTVCRVVSDDAGAHGRARRARRRGAHHAGARAGAPRRERSGEDVATMANPALEEPVPAEPADPHADLSSVLPLTAEIRDGRLWVGGVDMVELAREPGHRALRHGRGAHPPSAPRVPELDLVPLEATSRPSTRRRRSCAARCAGSCTRRAAWCCARPAASSPSRSRRGCRPSRIQVHGNNKTIAELTEAIEAGVDRIVVDSLLELERISAIADARGLRQAVLLRVTPGIRPDTHGYIQTGQEDSKFGFGLNHGLAMAGVQAACDLPGVDFAGLHMHIGSQIFALQSYSKAIEVMVDFMRQVRDRTGRRRARPRRGRRHRHQVRALPTSRRPSRSSARSSSTASRTSASGTACRCRAS